MDDAKPTRLIASAALTALPFAALVLVWWLLRTVGIINPRLLPSPFVVLAHFWTDLVYGDLGINIFMSVERVLAGLLLGTAAAVPVGFLIGWYQPVRQLIDPLINFFRALPPIALIPLVIVYLGIGDRERALDGLEKAYAAHSEWMAWLKMDRIFDPLRSQPRFIVLMKKLNFEK